MEKTTLKLLSLGLSRTQLHPCELLAIREGIYIYMDFLYSLQAKDVTLQNDCLEAIAEVQALEHDLLANIMED